MIEVVKQQLDGEDTILRLYECYGMRTDATLKLGRAPQSVQLVNLLEDVLSDADVQGDEVHLSLPAVRNPHLQNQVRFCLLGGPSAALILSHSVFLPIYS